jgi:hypothetical protein
LLKRHWALCVLAVGGTLLNLEMLEAPAISSGERQAKATALSAVDHMVSAAQSYGLYPDAAAWAGTSNKIAFSERETVFVTVLVLGFIATLPRRKTRD